MGDKISLPTLKGEVDLKVPVGTQPGDRVVLRNRGIPVLNGGGRRGHQYVHFNVVVPKKLSERQRELLDEFRKEEENGQIIATSSVVVRPTMVEAIALMTLLVMEIVFLGMQPIG